VELDDTILFTAVKRTYSSSEASTSLERFGRDAGLPLRFGFSDSELDSAYFGATDRLAAPDCRVDLRVTAIKLPKERMQRNGARTWEEFNHIVPRPRNISAVVYGPRTRSGAT
jgi:hypothetical protein